MVLRELKTKTSSCRILRWRNHFQTVNTQSLLETAKQKWLDQWTLTIVDRTSNGSMLLEETTRK